jgi:hypothetical protein
MAKLVKEYYKQVKLTKREIALLTKQGNPPAKPYQEHSLIVSVDSDNTEDYSMYDIDLYVDGKFVCEMTRILFDAGNCNQSIIDLTDWKEFAADLEIINENA